MFTVSDLFKTYVAASSREMEVKAVIGATTYADSAVVEFTIEDSLVSSDEFTFGTVITAKLTLKLMTTDSIAINAKITPYCRLNGTSGYTDWYPLGAFYIDNRSYKDGIWTFVCYDALIKTRQTYVSVLTYPDSMQDVWDEMCTQLGYTTDASVTINATYEIPYEDEDITMYDMFSYIASAHGASIRMTKDEKVAWVKYAPGASTTAIATSKYFKCEQTNPSKDFTKLICTYNTDGEVLTSGTGDDDHTLNFYNPYMTQAMLDTVLTAFTGFTYVPFTMEWKGYMYLEPGDAVQVTLRDSSTITSTILTHKTTYKNGMKETLTAPSKSTQQSEFGFLGTITQQLINTVKQETAYYGVVIGRDHGIRITKSDGISEALFNSDELKFTKNGNSVFYLDSNGDIQMIGYITAAGLKNANGDTLLSADGKLYIDYLTSLNVANPIIRLFSHTGTAQAGASTTITLASAASSTDDTYNNMDIVITSGTGSGQTKTITDYVGSTRVATVESAWTTNPDETSVYEVRGPAIDATANNEQGIGQELRYKWSRYDYILIGPDGFWIYQDGEGIKQPRIFVQSTDPSLDYTMQDNDIWIQTS